MQGSSQNRFLIIHPKIAPSPIKFLCQSLQFLLPLQFQFVLDVCYAGPRIHFLLKP